MTGSAAINCRSTAAIAVLSHMGCDPTDAQVGHEIPGVVDLVGTKRFLMRPPERTHHPQS